MSRHCTKRKPPALKTYTNKIVMVIRNHTISLQAGQISTPQTQSLLSSSQSWGQIFKCVLISILATKDLSIKNLMIYATFYRICFQVSMSFIPVKLCLTVQVFFIALNIYCLCLWNFGESWRQEETHFV